MIADMLMPLNKYNRIIVEEAYTPTFDSFNYTCTVYFDGSQVFTCDIDTDLPQFELLYDHDYNVAGKVLKTLFGNYAFRKYLFSLEMPKATISSVDLICVEKAP